ncbi:unnamed protein product [Mytilus edulis]|uniref:Reverse transcriptase domain-containing protein n=1 Tax=Mytilus edulis TaxID=6550 RepID=A0A8S3T8X4_MYTED|nr:unnamed protein product [Mytilus edulis]
MTEILNRSKYHYWMWRQEGTSDKLSIHYQQMRVLKKKLRSEQRKIESAKRQSKFTDIMSLSDRNDKNFYTLINNQRNLRSSVTSILKYDNKIINTEEEILDTWASYYEKLATPVDNPDFDDTYKLIVEQDISALTDTYTNNRDTLAPVSEKEVVQIINSLKNGKAPDASRVTCEHLKFGGKTLSYVLTSIITFSFSNHIIPTVFKNGLACPVFKKKGKPKEDPGSYRKITITNPVGKLTEKLHLVRNKDNISNIQSPLQKGFTQGEIPLVAALILTELHTEAKENGNPLIIALTDAKSAFDSKWKKLVNSLVNYYWITKLKSEASEKSSLNLLNYTDAEFGSIHSIWNTCGSEPYSTLRACIKSKLACNTYTLQCDKSKFSKRQISAICPLCGIEDENRLHFILRCSSLDNVRNSFIQSLKTFIKDVVTTKLYDELFSSEINTLQLIIDCSVFHFLSRGDVFKVECITRGLCFKLHQVRSNLLR